MDAQGQVAFFDPQGRAIAAAPPPPRLGADPVADLVRANRRRGVAPGWNTILPNRHRDAGVHREIEAAAWYALDRAEESAAARLAG